MADPTTRPSERLGKHDQLLADHQKALDSIAQRITEAEAKAEEARIKFEAAAAAAAARDGGRREDGGAVVPAGGAGEGWASYLDEESGKYYWFNEHTGEAYYHEGDGAAAS